MKLLGFSCSLVAASAAFGQAGGIVVNGASGPQVRNAAGRVTSASSFSPRAFIPPAVTGAPYSAEQTQEHVQTLSDGTHITQTRMRTKIYRDSEGRTRTERPLMMPLAPNPPESPLVVEITDPVAGVCYTLDTQNKIAHRVTVDPARNGRRVAVPPLPPPAPPPRSQIVAPPSNPARPDFAEEKLPPQIIEGVLAEGVRRTTTFPTGAQGNDRPFSVTSETWTSPDLKGLVVLSKNDDPRSGESATKFTNISRNEPDPGLFQPPPDYQIVDETRPFTIRYTQQ